MVWMAVVLDSGAQTIARPRALDNIETALNDPSARHNRLEAMAAIWSGRWETLAREWGVTDDEIECFKSWPAEDRAAILAGVAEVLAADTAGARIAFVPGAADHAYVNAESDGRTVAVTLAGPVQ